VHEIHLTEKQMASYTGLYKFELDQPSADTIFIKNGNLFLQPNGAPHAWQMHFTKPRAFYMYQVFPNNHVFSIDS
jgi:hypothetical protein